MLFAISLLIASVAAGVAGSLDAALPALLRPWAELFRVELVVFAGLGGLSGLVLFVLALRRWWQSRRRFGRVVAGPRRVRPRRGGGQPAIFIDGSNVLYWNGGEPSLDSVAAVLADLQRRGFAPVVWFDANAGYLVEEQYLGPEALARRLGLEARQVCVAPKGTPADPLLIDAATRMRARIVSNDRYRDWMESHPALAVPGTLIRGGFRDGSVWLSLEEASSAAA